MTVDRLDRVHGRIYTAQQVEVIKTCTDTYPHDHCAACGERVGQNLVFCDRCEF